MANHDVKSRTELDYTQSATIIKTFSCFMGVDIIPQSISRIDVEGESLFLSRYDHAT